MTNRELRREHRVSISKTVQATYAKNGSAYDRYEIEIMRGDRRRPFYTGRVVAVAIGKSEAEARANANVIANAIAADRERKREVQRA